MVATLGAFGMHAPDTTTTEGPSVEQVCSRLAPDRRRVRGLFSGGTLCYESLVVLGRTIGEVHSNTPINKAWAMPAPEGSHQCLDLGEEEYTRGRPHPMIDPEARIELLGQHAQDPQVAVIILDVVLGHGSDPDPAGDAGPGVSVRDGRRRRHRSSPTSWAPTRIRRASPVSARPWCRLVA